MDLDGRRVPLEEPGGGLFGREGGSGEYTPTGESTCSGVLTLLGWIGEGGGS